MLAILGLTAGACAPASTSGRRAVPSYDNFTGRLIQLSADLNGDGRLDQWTYLDGNRPLRGEADTDGDGRIDRWEYFDRQASLVAIGASSLGDGIEDTWSDVATSTGGELHLARSRRRDRQLDRHEYYRGTALVRVEEDTNADGRIDRWDRYDDGSRRQVDFDTTLQAGRPNRRLLYDASGRFVRIETDPELDGTFVELTGPEAQELVRKRK